MGKTRRRTSATQSKNTSTGSEISVLRADLHAFHGALCRELREQYDQYADSLANIYSEQVDAFCARDKADTARKS